MRPAPVQRMHYSLRYRLSRSRPKKWKRVMLHLQFVGMLPADSATIGPAHRFRIAGNFIRDAQTGDILANYLNHFWHVQGKCFTRYDCGGPVLMHFEDLEGGETPHYGPFDDLSVADGSVHFR